MEFTRFDGHQSSETEFEEAAAFLAAMDAVDRPGWPSRSGAQLKEFVHRGAASGYEEQLWFGSDAGDGGDGGDGGWTAAGWLHLPTTDNEKTVVVEIRVRPDLRRRGVATDFLRALMAPVHAAGRSHVIGATASHGPGESWGATVGLLPTLRYVQQDLILAEADQALWDRSAPDGYRLRSWTGPRASTSRGRRGDRGGPRIRLLMCCRPASPSRPVPSGGTSTSSRA
jgi:GNAT superfamily N-acetyltransferase